MDEWDWVTVVSGSIGLVAALVFLFAYLHRSGLDAWRNPFGRYLITTKVLLAALFATVILNRVGGSWWNDWRQPAAAIMIAAFAARTFWPYRLLLKAQEEARHSEEAQ